MIFDGKEAPKLVGVGDHDLCKRIDTHEQLFCLLD